MWSSTNLQIPATWLDTNFNSQLKIAVDAVTLPLNKAVPNLSATDALTDSARRTNLDLLQNNLDAIMITPWQHGQFSSSKNNMNFWLSPEDAQNYLSEYLSSLAWESAVLLMVTDDTPAQLTQSLINLLAIFPDVDLAKSLRHSQALSSHENKKLFIPGIQYDDKKTLSIEQLNAFTALSSAKQNIAISEATASDDNPQTMLANFQVKRSTRLNDIKTTVDGLISQNGLIDYALHLAGGDLSATLRTIAPPSDSAPLCCLLALGGATSDLAPLVEALSL